MPSWEGSEEQETDEGEDDGDDAVEYVSGWVGIYLCRDENLHQVWEDDHILELTCKPE